MSLAQRLSGEEQYAAAIAGAYGSGAAHR